MSRAVLYIPGLGQESFGQSASLVADRIVRSLQARLSSCPPFEYERETSAATLDEHPDFELDIVSLKITQGQESRTFLSIIEIKYVPPFVKPLSDAAPAGRFYEGVRLLRSSAVNYLRAVFARRRVSRLNDAAQGYLLVATLVSFAALVFWMMICLQSAFAIAEFVYSTEWVSKALATCSVIVSALAVFGFGRKAVIETGERTAIEYFSAEKYYKTDEHLPIHGVVLSALAWCKSREYDKIDVIGLSFGAILALDAIFPRQKFVAPPETRLDNLITIGYPYDLLESVHPGYFANRQSPTVAFSRWINVYIENDFLASRIEGVGITFADPNSGSRTPDINVHFKPDKKPVATSWKDFFLPGRRANNHCLYWDDQNAYVRSCFADIIDKATWTDEVRNILVDLSSARVPR